MTKYIKLPLAGNERSSFPAPILNTDAKRTFTFEPRPDAYSFIGQSLVSEDPNEDSVYMIYSTGGSFSLLSNMGFRYNKGDVDGVVHENLTPIQGEFDMISSNMYAPGIVVEPGTEIVITCPKGFYSAEDYFTDIARPQIIIIPLEETSIVYAIPFVKE